MAHFISPQLSPTQLVLLFPAKAARFLLFFLPFFKARDWFFYSRGIVAMARVSYGRNRGFWSLALCLGVGVALVSLTINMVILSRFLLVNKGDGADGSLFWGGLLRTGSTGGGCSRVGGGEGLCLGESPEQDTAEEMGEAAYGGGSAEQQQGTCSSSICLRSSASVINLDHGDPTMFETFWKGMGEKSSITIPGWQTMSYFSDVGNICWFLEPQFAEEIRRLHRLVGNARTDGRHIIVGTGSTQLFQALLYALSPPDAPEPVSVVSAIPYYSSYPAVTDFLQSRLYQWAGDANVFQGDSPYIELVCSPNNPDGSSKQAVLNSSNGSTIHDLAYYWPQYTAITSSADHKIMLFTVSKSTGHAGTRIGWALVKDKEVAKRMTKFIELNTIGVSKDSQLRAAKIIGAITNGYESPNSNKSERFFDHGRHLMTNRWERLREVIRSTGIFSLPEFSSEYCNFTGKMTESHPAFAWLKCEKEDIDDCESFLRSQKIVTRGGKHFGVDPKYVRVSMLDRDETFDLFIQRLLSIS